MAVTAPARSGCGCGRCGGADTHPSTGFTRPRFYAGQLLTEDDLQALTGYVTGKDRLRNRLLFGPGVVCGLHVACDPCGGGVVTVRPGYAIDPCGNDIVVGCAEKVDVVALVRDLRVRSLGADCGDPCSADGDRVYGLYVRYTEEAIEPIAPYATDESAPGDGCVPSRVRETYRFVVRCLDEDGDPRYTPGKAIAARLGDAEPLAAERARAARLAAYRRPLGGAVRAAAAPVLFDGDTRDRWEAAAQDLGGLGSPPTLEQARLATEHVRVLAGAVAAFDTYDQASQAELVRQYGVDATAARALLASSVSTLDGLDAEAVWPDPARRAMAAAVLAETQERVVDQRVEGAPLEARLVAQGAPLSYAMRAELIADLARTRHWLLGRLDRDRELADCGIREAVARADLPPALPDEPPPGREVAGATELSLASAAAGRLSTALTRYVTDVACASVLPPCAPANDGDVLLARLELSDCEVLRACAAERPQWLPGGPGYAAWAPVLYQARELAEEVCCEPLPVAGDPPPPAQGGAPVALEWVHGLLDGPPADSKLDELLALLAPAPAVPPAADVDLRREVAELRSLVKSLASAVRSTSVLDAAEEPEATPEPEPSPEPSPPAKAQQRAKAVPEPEPEPSPPAKAVPRKATRGRRTGGQEG
ncbi:hypothetical protein ACTMTJ_13650 [Phytohabitans sp. LJ34]|uniref:hypothetical protein n=1 Tax=Phytohabitans sp. LJ34 TaxID=3452217 RepID=UPI003F89CB72